MTEDQTRYHAIIFFYQIATLMKEDSEFEIEKDLRIYQFKNRNLYEFNKQDAFERHMIIDYLRKNDLIKFKDNRIVTDYYQLGQYGKDVINGKKKLLY